MSIPVSRYGKGYAKSSMGVNVFSAGGRRSRRRPRVSGSEGLETVATLFDPASNTVLATTANLTVKTTIDRGDVYVVIDTELIAVPSAAQVAAGLNGLGLAADFDGVDAAITILNATIAATGLVTATNYAFYFTHDIDGVLSAVVGNTLLTA